MKVRDAMSSPAISLKADVPAKAAAALLVSHGYAAAPVVDEGERVIGIATVLDRGIWSVPVTDAGGLVGVLTRREVLRLVAHGTLTSEEAPGVSGWGWRATIGVRSDGRTCPTRPCRRRVASLL